MKLIRKLILVCNCRKKLVLREYAEKLAVGGKCLERSWRRGAFTASKCLHSFPCPKCGDALIWKPMVDGAVKITLPDGIVMLSVAKRKKLRGVRKCTKRS